MQILQENNKSDFFRYLDFPSIPQKYLDYSISDIESHQNIFVHSNYEFYKQYKVFDKELLNFIQDIFCSSKLHITYQVIRNGIKIHRDIGRYEATNFLIQTGGSNVITTVYSDDIKSFRVSECIQPSRWHWINVGKPHGIQNITDVRLSISVENITGTP